MGRVTEVSVTYSRTVNLGNYESERLEVGQTATVAEDDLHDAVRTELMDDAQAVVLARLRQAAEARRLERTGAWRGTPPKPAVDEEDDPTTGGL